MSSLPYLLRRPTSTGAFGRFCRSADIDERAIGDRTRDPSDLVLRLGVAKAEALLPVLRAEAERGELEGATMLLTGDQGLGGSKYLVLCDVL